MQNPLLKSQLIENNDFAFYCKTKFINNLNVIDKIKGLEPDLSKLLDENFEYLFADLNYSDIELKSLNQLFDSRRQKCLRLKKRIKTMVTYCKYVYFLTLTWSDDVLNRTSYSTRRTYVQRFLSSLDYADYYANVDFGSLNEREHYHCIIALNSSDMPKWNYGFYFYELVRIDKKSFSRLASYVNKLTYHAFKDTTINARAICPKKTNYIINRYKFFPVRSTSLPFTEDL